MAHCGWQCVILAGLAGFLALFAPIYLRNLRLQNYVSALTQHVENADRSPTTSSGRSAG